LKRVLSSKPLLKHQLSHVAFLCLILILVSHVCKSYPTSDTSLSRVGCITRLYSTFTLTFTQFTILQLLPSAVSQLLLL
jgi:hypothetical protein